MRPTILRLLVAGSCAALLVVSYRLTGQAGPAVPASTIYRSSPVPDRIILTWSDDPATTAAVTWRTDTSVTKAVAQIAVADDGPGFQKQAKNIEAITELLDSSPSPAHYHSVQFTDLQPNSQYVYRVGDGFNWSDWNQFRTTARGPAPLEFIYVGDSQNDLYSLWSRVIRASYSDAPKARFILHAGDLINSKKDEEWGEWHAAAGWINRSVFSFPVPGNHEYEKITRQLTAHWRPQFTLPLNGVTGLEESCYYLDIQGVRVVALNSNERLKEQAEWLDRVLTNNPNRWTVLTFHHPVYSTAKGRDNKEVRETWQPIIDKHKVDIVLNGHDHTYGRSNLQTGLSTKEGGTVYVVSVSGPKQYELDREAWMQRSAEDTQLYQIIRIDGDLLKFEARTARGALYDAFELRKHKGKPNTLINKDPEMPERHRKSE